jgi:hypothetical protein
MLTRPIVSASIFFKHNIIMHEIYLEQYALDVDLKNVYATFCCTDQVGKLDSYVHGKLLYLGKLFFLEDERVNMIREGHYSLVVGNVGGGNMMASSQRNHPKFWDEHIHYFQHAYNRAKCSLNQSPPFEASFGYLPKSPLDFIFGKDVSIYGHSDFDKAKKLMNHVHIPSIDHFLSELHEDTILDRKTRSSKQGDVDYLCIGLKGTNPSKDRWIEVGKVRELYPHL